MTDEKKDNPLSLDECRSRIDEVDRRIVEALCERGDLVSRIGEVKRAESLPVYAPDRERAVIDRAVARNAGPLSNRTIEGVFREIMSGSFQLEVPLRVGFLGPVGTFSHLASVRHFGSTVEPSPLESIDAVFGEVAAGRLNFGLVPYENSIGGSIVDTLDSFQEHSVQVCAEALIDVSQCFLANCAPGEVKRICSRPEVFAQCRKWISARFPGVELVPVTSTSAGVQRAAGEGEIGTAAIGSSLAGEIFGVHLLFERIQDRPGNITRFLVIGKQQVAATGSDKTVIMFHARHQAGALVDVLDCFRRGGVNLSHIEKRPSDRSNWSYAFFIDCDHHATEPAMATAIAEARTHCDSLEVLGSFPRAQRIM
ncbi:MAG: prephenate dehydratase [Phycisphaerales bacterium]|nr:prephenate dehydratase [Phycisphaerales bacterium]